MKYSFYISIFSILFSLVANTSFTPIILPFEINDGEVKNVMNLISKIWIHTKIENDSQIIMNITCCDENRIIKKEDIQYGKYFKETNSSELYPINSFFSKGNNYKVTYDVFKDKNDYGLIEISNLGFNQRLSIGVKVVPKTTP